MDLMKRSRCLANKFNILTHLENKTTNNDGVEDEKSEGEQPSRSQLPILFGYEVNTLSPSLHSIHFTSRFIHSLFHLFHHSFHSLFRMGKITYHTIISLFTQI